MGLVAFIGEDDPIHSQPKLGFIRKSIFRFNTFILGDHRSILIGLFVSFELSIGHAPPDRVWIWLLPACGLLPREAIVDVVSVLADTHFVCTFSFSRYHSVFVHPISWVMIEPTLSFIAWMSVVLFQAIVQMSVIRGRKFDDAGNYGDVAAIEIERDPKHDSTENERDVDLSEESKEESQSLDGDEPSEFFQLLKQTGSEMMQVSETVARLRASDFLHRTSRLLHFEISLSSKS